MNSSYRFAAVIVVTLLAMLGCKSDPVRDDIVNYSKTAIPLYNRYTADIGRKMGDSKKTASKEEYAALISKELLPAFKEYKEKMAAVKPATKELQDIHAAYLASLASSEEGLTLLTKSIATGDKVLSKAASDKIDAAARGDETYKKDFNELAKKHGVKVE